MILNPLSALFLVVGVITGLFIFTVICFSLGILVFPLA